MRACRSLLIGDHALTCMVSNAPTVPHYYAPTVTAFQLLVKLTAGGLRELLSSVDYKGQRSDGEVSGEVSCQWSAEVCPTSGRLKGECDEQTLVPFLVRAVSW